MNSKTRVNKKGAWRIALLLTMYPRIKIMMTFQEN